MTNSAALPPESVTIGEFNLLKPVPPARADVECFLAQDGSGRPVVLSMLDKNACGPEGAQGMRLAQARLERVRDPRVNWLLNRGEAVFHGRVVLYCASPVVEGETLAAFLVRRGGTLMAAEVCALAVQGMEALAAAHAEGVSHGDLSPAAITLRPGRLLALTDFGLPPWPLGEGARRHLPAPELRAGGPATPAGDVFSAALCCLAAWCGTDTVNAWLAGTPGKEADLAAKALEAKPGLPVEVSRLLLQSLSPSPPTRPTAAALGAQWRAYLPGLPDLAPGAPAAAALPAPAAPAAGHEGSARKTLIAFPAVPADPRRLAAWLETSDAPAPKPAVESAALSLPPVEFGAAGAVQAASPPAASPPSSPPLPAPPPPAPPLPAPPVAAAPSVSLPTAGWDAAPAAPESTHAAEEEFFQDLQELPPGDDSPTEKLPATPPPPPPPSLPPPLRLPGAPVADSVVVNLLLPPLPPPGAGDLPLIARWTVRPATGSTAASAATAAGPLPGGRPPAWLPAVAGVAGCLVGALVTVGLWPSADPGTGTIRVLGTLKNQAVQVDLDGETVGTAPVEIREVTAGTHVVVVRAPKAEPAVQVVAVEKGKQAQVSAAPVVHAARLRVVSPAPDVQVVLGEGKPQPVPAVFEPLELGSKVEVTLFQGSRLVETTVELAGEEVVLHFEGTRGDVHAKPAAPPPPPGATPRPADTPPAPPGAAPPVPPPPAGGTAAEALAAGNKALLAGRFDEAERDMRQALQRDPATVEAWRVLGIILTRQGKPCDGLAAYRRYVDARPQAADGDRIKGIIKELEGRYPDCRGPTAAPPPPPPPPPPPATP